jgi:tetratricopeptide (TPR) repeat protein
MSDISLKAPFESYTGEEPYIFISYAHIDGMIVFPELMILHELGFRIWYDEGIEPGNEWTEEVARALENAAYFIVFISPGAVSSRNVRNEINFALSNNKPFLAIHINETQLPSGLGLQMGSIQAILKYNMPDETFLRKIIKTLPLSLKTQIQIPTPKVPYPKPIPNSINKLKNGYYFIVQEEEPYYIKYREEELPIIFQPFKSQNNNANNWFLQAEKMFYNLKIEEATRFYKRTIEEDSKFLEAYLKLALMSWLYPTANKNSDAINYCITGFESNNQHIIGSFLIYLYLNNNVEEAKSILYKLINSKIIENKNQLAGLYLLQSRLFNTLKDYDQELENLQKASEISPFFGPSLRQLSKIYLRQNEFDKAETLLKNAFEEYSKHVYCHNWLDTRDMLVNIYGQAGRNEMLFNLLNENCSVQKLLNNEERFPSVKSNIYFEGEIDGIISKGYLVNGTGFSFNQALLQDGFEKGNNVLCDFNVNDSSELFVFYDLRFGGSIVKIDNISFLMKIVQNNNTACLVQTNNGFKLSGTKDGFPNLWFVHTDSSIQPSNLSLTNSFNIKRV